MRAAPAPTTTVRLPVVLVERLRIIAAAHERSVAAELRVALEGYIRREAMDARDMLRWMQQTEAERAESG